jgi:hypothetical protein
MPSPRDKNPYKGPWRVDLRLISELPEDDVVGRKFLINSITGTILLLVALVTGWHFYLRMSVASELETWRETLNRNRAASNEVKNLRTLLFGDAAKVEYAHGQLHSPIALSRLLVELGRTRPDIVRLEKIEGDDAAVLIRGSMLESSTTRASQILGRYVEQLRKHPVIGEGFSSITLAGIGRDENAEGLITFDLALRAKP